MISSTPTFFYTIKINTTNHHVQVSSTWDLVKEKAVEGKESATEKVTLLIEKVVEFFLYHQEQYHESPCAGF